jgi:hypothetical protein
MLHAFKEVGQLQELDIRVISGDVTGTGRPNIHTAHLEKLDGLFLTVGQCSGEYRYFDLTIGFCFDQFFEGFGKKLIRIKGVILVIEFQGNFFGQGIDYPKHSYHRQYQQYT